MKISVDAILLGAWCNPEGRNILDIGTGCGVIALMCTQRNEKAIVHAIDIDGDSVEEAAVNFKSSLWKERLYVEKGDFLEHMPAIKYDLIVSNPPYFDSGVMHPATIREKARHDSALPLCKLLEKSVTLLAPEGRIALILPFSRKEQLCDDASKLGLIIQRCCLIKGHESAPVKRMLVELVKGVRQSESDNIEILILQGSDGNPTEKYQKLGSEFYLNF